MPIEEQGFDPAEHLIGNPFGFRKRLYDRGISVDPYLIVDYSKNFIGGVNTHGDSFRQRFNMPLQIDAEKLFGAEPPATATVRSAPDRATSDC